MSALLISALLLGLLGSLHCLGMCGPIAVALPGHPEPRVSYIAGRTLYNLGRVGTYMLMGAAAGLLGQGVAALGAQRGLSIGIGALLLLGVLLGPKRISKLGTRGPLAGLVRNVQSRLARLLRDPRPGTLLVVGLLNGLLPCGLVYVAIAGAATTGTMVEGVLYMMLFGLGTVPLMLAAALAGPLVINRFRGVMRKAIPMGLAALAVLLIWRGFMSPEHCHTDTAAPSDTPSCCNHG